MYVHAHAPPASRTDVCIGPMPLGAVIVADLPMRVLLIHEIVSAFCTRVMIVNLH